MVVLYVAGAAAVCVMMLLNLAALGAFMRMHTRYQRLRRAVLGGWIDYDHIPYHGLDERVDALGRGSVTFYTDAPLDQCPRRSMYRLDAQAIEDIVSSDNSWLDEHYGNPDDPWMQKP